MIRKTFTTVAAILSCVACVEGQELFTNGDMGTFTGTSPNALPTSWTRTTGTLPSSQSGINSPFTNAYADNSSAWNINYVGDAAGTSGFNQVFSVAALLSIAVNFDFRLPTAVTGNTWGIQFDNAINSSVHFRIDAAGKFSINSGAGTPAVPLTDILTITPGTWYNVQATFDTTANTNIGSITPFGGTAVTFNQALLNGSAGFTRLLVRDRSAAMPVNDDLQIDNVSVGAVPEPSGVVSLALGGLVLFLSARTHGRRSVKAGA